MSTAIRLATRGSAQALTQSESVASRLNASGFETEMVIIETKGDRTQAAGVPLHSIGGQGVFTKEVQAALLDGRADVAVHSTKDLMTTEVPGLMIGAFTERRNAADALIGRRLSDLPLEATVATGSVRRRAQLHRARPDLQFVELRGNIHTRLERIPEGGSIVMAIAALEVLGHTDLIAEELDPAEFVPSPGQGCVAAECRSDDERLIAALESIDHSATREQVLVERAFMAELGSGCSLPIGAYVHAGRLFTFLANETSGVTISDTIELTGTRDGDLAIARQAAVDALNHVNGR